MNSLNPKTIIIALVVFAVVMIVLSRLFSDKSSKHAKKSLAKISREGEVDQDFDVDLLNANSADKLGEALMNKPIIGKMYKNFKQAGMDISFGVYVLILIGMFGVSTYLMSRIFQSHAFIPPMLGFVITKIISGVVIGMKLEKRNNMFLTDFPDAIDMIVRSVRSGHPLLSSLALIAQNSRPPLSTEFQRVIDEVSYGRALSESLRKMADRIGIIDINFFVVILSVQQETGGSLAEVLNNLSTIIRKRKQLRLKIRALTSEGRITAKIFAAIPLAQLGIMRLMYQNALDPLFNTNQGLMCLGVAGFFIIMAIFIANKMCNVDV